MKILHIEASLGWGGQEMRTLNDAIGMRARGHGVIFAVGRGAPLGVEARKAGFVVYELPMKRSTLMRAIWGLMRILYKERISLINTHSSFDGWLAGIIGRMWGIAVIRTRHLSTQIRKGLNSFLLYNAFADCVVTTCRETARTIVKQAHLPQERCLSIPTGTDSNELQFNQDEVGAFRKRVGCAPDDILIGTLCILRSWKGVADLLQAAKLLEGVPRLRWVVVGSGPSEAYFLDLRDKLGLRDRVVFTGFLSPVATALASFDIFVLLSHAHEAVSQASLQAGFLSKPLITTPTGGLKEVCIDRETGFLVPAHAPGEVARAVQLLVDNPALRSEMGSAAHRLVSARFMRQQTIEAMECVYKKFSGQFG